VDCEKELRDEATAVLQMIPIDKGVLWEIGCAGGFFLDEARRKGFTVMGIEPNESMASFGRNRLGLKIIHAGIEDVDVKDLPGQCDVLVFMDVLEHIPQPCLAMAKVGLWLRDNGYLFVRGPLANDVISKVKQWLRRVIGKEKQLPSYPLDVNIFSKKSLTCLLRNSGINVVSWINETKGFANLLAQKVSVRSS
jgi:2-polyprenyl-3-methyl-5-hydroxy-6-metoxy-1,4-benzoquinol methylase